MHSLEDWTAERLSDLLTLEYGSGLTADARKGEGILVFGSNGVVGEHSKHLVEGPGIIVGRKGTVGAIVWSSGPFWPIDTTYYVKLRKPADWRWLYWRLSSSGLKRLDSSTGVPGLNRNDAYRLPVLTPPKSEQQRIAEILDTIDEAIRKTEEVIAKLRQMKQGLLHDLLTRGLDDNGELRDPDRYPEQFHMTPLGRLPKGWAPATLDDVVDRLRPVVYGILMPGQGFPGGVPVVKVKDIIDGIIKTDQLLLTSPALDFEYRRSRLISGDLLFTIRGTVGRMAFVPDPLTGANITQDTARLAITGANPHFVRQFIELPLPQRFISIHTIGQAVKGINLRDVRRIPLALPKPHEQHLIAAQLKEMDDRIAFEWEELRKLSLLKQGLMDDLLTGRVRVTKLIEKAA
jgi:type I restriction enzyme, S subunit